MLQLACHKDSASPSELEAALLACPGNKNALMTACGVGYTGVRCLACAHGYGAAGPYCDGISLSLV